MSGAMMPPIPKIKFVSCSTGPQRSFQITCIHTWPPVRNRIQAVFSLRHMRIADDDLHRLGSHCLGRKLVSQGVELTNFDIGHGQAEDHTNCMQVDEVLQQRHENQSDAGGQYAYSDCNLGVQTLEQRVSWNRAFDIFIIRIRIAPIPSTFSAI